MKCIGPMRPQKLGPLAVLLVLLGSALPQAQACEPASRCAPHRASADSQSLTAKAKLYGLHTAHAAYAGLRIEGRSDSLASLPAWALKDRARWSDALYPVRSHATGGGGDTVAAVQNLH